MNLIFRFFCVKIFSMFFCMMFFSYAQAQEASVNVVAMLPTVLSVESLYVDQVKVNSKIPTLKVKEVTRAGEDLNILKLSSIRYSLKTNAYQPIRVNVEFSSLSSNEYSFSKDKLTVQAEYNNEDNDSMLKSTPEFTPYVKVNHKVPPGMYNGSIILTISCL